MDADYIRKSMSIRAVWIWHMNLHDFLWKKCLYWCSSSMWKYSSGYTAVIRKSMHLSWKPIPRRSSVKNGYKVGENFYRSPSVPGTSWFHERSQRKSGRRESNLHQIQDILILPEMKWCKPECDPEFVYLRGYPAIKYERIYYRRKWSGTALW